MDGHYVDFGLLETKGQRDLLHASHTAFGRLKRSSTKEEEALLHTYGMIDRSHTCRFIEDELGKDEL